METQLTERSSKATFLLSGKLATCSTSLCNTCSTMMIVSTLLLFIMQGMHNRHCWWWQWWWLSAIIVLNNDIVVISLMILMSTISNCQQCSCWWRRWWRWWWRRWWRSSPCPCSPQKAIPRHSATCAEDRSCDAKYKQRCNETSIWKRHNIQCQWTWKCKNEETCKTVSWRGQRMGTATPRPLPWLRLEGGREGEGDEGGGGCWQGRRASQPGSQPARAGVGNILAGRSWDGFDNSRKRQSRGRRGWKWWRWKRPPAVSLISVLPFLKAFDKIASFTLFKPSTLPIPPCLHFKSENRIGH